MEIRQTQNSFSKQIAVVTRCHQFGLTEEEKGRANLSVDKKMLTNLQQVQVLSPPTIAPGNRTRENVLSFEALASKMQLTQLCEKTLLPISCDSREAVQSST